MNIKPSRQLNIKLPKQDIKILEAFCEKTERTKTDVVREFIRSLPQKMSDPPTAPDIQ